jgi:hypothetical protein
MSPDLLKFNHAIAEARQSDDVWNALRQLSLAIIGHKLFTVMTVDMEAGLARRAYTDHPLEYPVSGTKPIHRDAWFDIVHGEKRSFVANTIADIAKVFPDYELIRSLGCGAVINLPVVLNGQLAATINLLHEEHYYTPERVAAVEARLAGPAKRCCERAAQFDILQRKPD